MNEFIKILLSLSVSGTLLLLFILGLKQIYRNKFSRRWQYYIWIIVVLRFLLPFTLDTMNIRSVFEMFRTTAITNESPVSSNIPVVINMNDNEPKQLQIPTNENIIVNAVTKKPLNVYVYLFFTWSAVALILFIRKITIYQGFIQYIKAGNTEVSDLKILNLLSDCEEKLNIKKQIELYRNVLIASPIMIGFFRPSIVLPVRELEDKELSYIFAHELIHYKQRDMFYKWLIQIVICIHWFNPFVYLLEKEVNKACELSCDEAVISVLDDEARREYGDTLINFLKSNNLCKNSLASVTLTEGAEQLKERLGVIMNFKKKSRVIQFLMCLLTLCIIFGAAFVGVYPVAASDNLVPIKIDVPLPIQSDDSPVMEVLEFGGTTYYLVFNEAQLRAIGSGEYGLDQNYMQQADIQLSTNEWIPIGTWDNPFTGSFNGNGYEIIGLTMTDPNAEIIGLFGVAKKAHIYNVTMRDYDITNAGRDVSKKSVGAIVAVEQGSRSYDNFVYPKEIEEDKSFDWNWGNDWDFDWDDEDWDNDEWDFDWDDENWNDDKAFSEIYAAYGIEKKGRSIYYQGELIYVFLDHRPNSSFYRLDMNPEGTASIQIIHDQEGKITGVSYMTEEEVADLIGEPFGWQKEIPVINTREWDSSELLMIEAYYKTDNIYIFPSISNKVILKEYLTEDQSGYYANTELKNNVLTIHAGDRPTINYKSYIEIYVPNDVLENIKVETVSGAITVDDFTGVVELSTISGGINIFDSNTAGSVNTISGSIGLYPSDLSGDLYVNSHSGKISAVFPTSISYNVKAETKAGEIKGSYFDTQSKNKKEFLESIGRNPKVTVSLKTFSANIEIN